MNFEKETGLDQVDLKILQIMQEDGRISNADLGRKLGMVPSGVYERIKKLEQKGVIQGYTVRINPDALQQKLLAFIFLKVTDGQFHHDLTSKIAAIPEVQEVHQIAGDDCYLVKVRTDEIASLMQIMRNKFPVIPNLVSTRTTIVLETIKEQQRLFIPDQL
jgi:Lrp/AsnC family leucine-responsive transcriptional regulator